MARKKRKTKSARLYMSMIRRIAAYKRRGKKGWAQLRKKASAYRKRLIKANRVHRVAPILRMSRKSPKPQSVRAVERMSGGKKGLRRFSKFWRIPHPPTVKILPGGSKKKEVIVGMGFTPEMHISKKPRGVRGQDRRKIDGMWYVGVDVSGRNIILHTGKRFGKRFHFVGFAPETHYIPTADIEKAGTHKRRTHWRHLHHDDGGQWPKVYADTKRLGRNTNFVYAKGTYRVTDWIRR